MPLPRMLHAQVRARSASPRTRRLPHLPSQSRALRPEPPC
jgi:hypothetical protein